MSVYFGQLPINGMMYNGHECSAMYNGNLIWPTATPSTALSWSASGSLTSMKEYGGLDPLTGTIASLSETPVDFLMAASPDSFYCTSTGTTYVNPTSDSGTVMQSGYIHSSLSFYYSASIGGWWYAENSGYLFKPKSGFITDLSQANDSWSTNGIAYSTYIKKNGVHWTALTAEYRLSAESGRFHGPKTAAQYPVRASTISAYMPYVYNATNSGHRALYYSSFWSASGVYIPE